jgi:hypothetical protein
LEESGLRTMPDFEFAYRDAAILVEPNSATPEAIPGNELSERWQRPIIHHSMCIPTVH